MALGDRLQVVGFVLVVRIGENIHIVMKSSPRHGNDPPSRAYHLYLDCGVRSII